MSDSVSLILSRLADEDALRKSRVHPLQILLALSTYRAGHGVRGGGSWTPVPQVVDALDNAFYASFGNVESTGKRTLIGLDVSSSMTQGIAGTHLSCAEAAAAMCLVTAKAEYNNYGVVAFSDGLTILPISPEQRMDEVINMTYQVNFGRTDCAIPMIAAQQQGWDIDTFIIYTDNETWAGSIHPAQALQEYRNKSGRNAKLIVAGMASNGFSIADPSDAGMLDVVGFDGATPQVISEFSKGL